MVKGAHRFPIRKRAIFCEFRHVSGIAQSRCRMPHKKSGRACLVPGVTMLKL